ncbi:hypothetical protein ACVWXO_004862 [Bradyrhizobium sp. LM2.7]
MQAEAAPAAALYDAAELIRRASALIFDVDGTLAETEELHRQAFNEAFLRHSLAWHWDRAVYKDLLRVTGGKERIRAYHERQRAAAPLSDVDIAELHRIKTAHYAELVETGCCPLRSGVAELLAAARSRGAAARDRDDHLARQYRCAAVAGAGEALGCGLRGHRRRRRCSAQEACAGRLSRNPGAAEAGSRQLRRDRRLRQWPARGLACQYPGRDHPQHVLPGR